MVPRERLYRSKSLRRRATDSLISSQKQQLIMRFPVTGQCQIGEVGRAVGGSGQTNTIFFVKLFRRGRVLFAHSNVHESVRSVVAALLEEAPAGATLLLLDDPP